MEEVFEVVKTLGIILFLILALAVISSVTFLIMEYFISKFKNK